MGEAGTDCTFSGLAHRDGEESLDGAEPQEEPRLGLGQDGVHPLLTDRDLGAPCGRNSDLSRRPTFTLLNGDTAAGRPALSAFFHGAHPAFGFRANAEAYTADDHTDTRRRGPFLHDPASLRSRFLNDVVVRKTRRLFNSTDVA